MKPRVIKRDGTTEPFDPEKIDRVVAAAGLTPDQATTLVATLTNWINSQNTSEVSSLVIRDKVIEELQKIDAYAANMFMWYEKTKDKASGA